VSGLAKVDAPSGTLISFATRPGSTASDGMSGHGVYTEQLLAKMKEPNQPIEQVLKRVSADVKRATRGAQEPWMEGSIEGDFYFRGGGAAASAPPITAGPIDPLAVELAFWDSVKNSSNSGDYQAYLEKYPNGQFAPIAKQRAMAPPAPAPDRVASAAPTSRAARPLIAIVGFENKSTYGADKLWDTSGQLVFSNLMEMGTFRVVEWDKMKRLFEWHDLSTNALVKAPT
jgi:hypothetical protein